MALNIENIIAEIKEASILELNDLVKAIEEEFGVTAAAPVAAAAAGAADAGAAGVRRRPVQHTDRQPRLLRGPVHPHHRP